MNRYRYVTKRFVPNSILEEVNLARSEGRVILIMAATNITYGREILFNYGRDSVGVEEKGTEIETYFCSMTFFSATIGCFSFYR